MYPHTMFLTKISKITSKKILYIAWASFHNEDSLSVNKTSGLTTTSKNKVDFYAPNFEEVEGAYWFGSVHAVQ